MNFAALPPEVNSALMYAGPGSGPIRAAATAWKTMAAELETAANAYRTVIATLTDQTWQGPAATAMATAATPYLAWMNSTATQAATTGSQAATAAAAYETAFAMTVPPPVITANRTQLATLIATNLLGQNTAAIAANEAHYSAMWTQDATAMYGYAGNAATATQLPAYTAPGPTTTGAAPATPGAAITPGLAFDLAAAVLEVGSVVPFGSIGLGGAFGGMAITLGELALPEEGALGLGALGGLDLIGRTAPSGRGATWAGMGKSVPVGALSVPRTWAAATPAELREITLVTAQSGTSAAAAATAGAEIPFAEMGLAGMAGRNMTCTVVPGRRSAAAPPNPTIAPASPKPADESDDPDQPVRPKSIGVVAELRALVELRDSGVLSQQKFIERKERLLGE
ncbi:PPE family protein PPE51_2 [Mycolicibacter sinensis]|uniref:PPE family protein PPE51_2 n=1 Tax=Mycolicibacter sinensis (strain JDM601) TaxID=875328 RepID=F5YSC8_MYCSD|nr:PPE domain-containing protein [Mycolicibacter sinensis]AEF37926.1 PPE family protein PPE51_2 [Mycolicibacter sinensis]